MGFIENFLGLAIPAVGICYVLDIPLYVAGVSLFNEQYLSMFWALITVLIFLTVPATKKSKGKGAGWLDLVLAVLTLFIGLYVAVFYPQILNNLGTPSRFQLVFGLLAVLVVLESVRRTTGWPIVIIILLFILYAKFGNLAPGILRTRGLYWSRLFQQLYVGSSFMFGIPLRVAAGMVFGFILFGNVVMRTGGGDFLFNFAQGLMGRYRGGPAKVAVLASTFFGTLSGSAVANVAGTGMVTIPMMKRTGYPPSYAGAIEATASTGGQIVPPVMGAAAFVIAEFLGISYAVVVFAALIPAMLYYYGLFLQVDLRAASTGLEGLPREAIPSLKKTLREGWIFILPLMALVVTLFILFMSPGSAALYSTVVVIAATLLRKESRSAWTWSLVKDILNQTSKTLFELAAVSAAAGFVVGIVGYTGLGLSMSRVLTEAAGGSLILLALLTALTSTILGMGMPTTAAYILLAVLAAPALTNLGVEPILAHLFIFYYGTLSMLTPPVCLACYAAASIAKTPQMPLAFRAMRLAVAGYVVPIIFLYEPGLALIGTPLGIIYSILVAVVAISFFAFGVEGFFLTALKKHERLLAMVIAVAVFTPNSIIRVIGLVLLVFLLVVQLRKRKAIQPFRPVMSPVKK
ncbi:MAG: TRAP transporter fused permease subunit [Pseudomonadota bacterium]